MAKITLTNDYHNTVVTLCPRSGRLSVAQVRKAKRVLCGVAGCTCGDDAGCRGPQPVMLDWCHDGSARVVD